MEDDADSPRDRPLAYRKRASAFTVMAHDPETRPFHGVTRAGPSRGVLRNPTRRPEDSASTNKPQNLSDDEDDENKEEEDLYWEVRKYNPVRRERRPHQTQHDSETSEKRAGNSQMPEYGQLEPSGRREHRRDGVEQRKAPSRRSPSRHEAPQNTSHHLEDHHFSRLNRTHSDVKPEEHAARHRALHERAAAEREKGEEAEADGWAVPEKGDWI
ncbi:hypothetical protein JCM5353_008829 [Sporobolomyces roseus]